MFIWNGIRTAGNLAKAVAGCLCCLILAGPILIIVGIVLLAVKNTREDDVASYNQAVTAYDGTEVGSWVPGIVNLTSSSGSGPLTLYTNQPVIVEGNTEGVNTGYSNVLRGNLEPRSVSGSYHTVSFSLTSVPKFEQSVPISIIKTSTPWCSDARGCTTTRMGDICRGDHGPEAVWRRKSSGSCSKSGSCGTCEYPAYLSTYCVVISSRPPYGPDPTLKSCFYPFDSTSQSQKYARSDRNDLFEVQVRKADDPFIALQRITKGDENFGLTAGQQRGIAFGCLSLGVIFVLTSIGVGYWLYGLIRRVMSPNKPADTYSFSGHQPSLVPPQMYSSSPSPTNAPVEGYPMQEYPPQSYVPPPPPASTPYVPYQSQQAYPPYYQPYQPYAPNGGYMPYPAPQNPSASQNCIAAI